MIVGVTKQRSYWLRSFLGSRLPIARFLVSTILVGMFLSTHAFPQWVCAGKGGKPCTNAEINEMVCKPEKAPVNLIIDYPVKLSGIFIDQSGAPIDFDEIDPKYQTIVQIKSQDTEQILFAVPLRTDGRFEFERVPSGAYRLILVRVREGKFFRLPTADQPNLMHCSDKDDCTVHQTITFHGSDNPVDWCPPK
jgi:hypothetical protein